mgnify:CR=1 FL=1
MQVLEPVTALLSDYEVFTLLQSNKASRRANQNASENVLTVEFEVNSIRANFCNFDSILRLWNTLQNWRAQVDSLHLPLKLC